MQIVLEYEENHTHVGGLESPPFPIKKKKRKEDTKYR
jgi:hypothetical protein